MPNYLYIDGKAFDDAVIINSISCSHGRTDITQQPSPSTFRAQFYLAPGAVFPTPINLGSSVGWNIYDSTATGTQRPIFIGKISDVQITLEWSNGSGLYLYDVTAIDNLATLNNKSTTAGFAKDFEGNRIASIIGTWGYDTSGIDTPGDYEIAVHASGTATNALQLAQEAAQSGMGVLYCQPNSNGKIRYQTYLNRKLNTEISLSTSDVLSADFALSTTTNLVVNQAALTYGTGSSGTVYDDTASQAIYGVRSGIRETTLHNVADANSQAQILLAARKDPAYSLRSLTVDTATISDSLRSQIAQIEIGTRISILGLPTPELASFAGFIEGYTWTTSRGHDIIQMNLSNVGDLYPYTMWNQLNSTDTWNTYALSTTKWSDLT